MEQSNDVRYVNGLKVIEIEPDAPPPPDLFRLLIRLKAALPPPEFICPRPRCATAK